MKHYSEHSQFCKAISALEEIQLSKQKEYQVTNKEPIPAKTKHYLVKLVGDRPIIKCFLDNKTCFALWDTGSMISLISKTWLHKNFGNVYIHSLQDFTGDDSFILKAANNTDVPIEGVVLLEFSLEKDNKNMFIIPFLVTLEEIRNPVLGYNTIEHLVLNFKGNNLPSLLKNCLPKISLIETEKFINLIEHNSKMPDFLGEVKVCQNSFIPANSFVYIKCKSKFLFDEQEKAVLFSPIVDGNLDNELNIWESFERIKKGKTPYVHVRVENPNSEGYHLSKGTIMGTVHNVSAVIPLNVNAKNVKNFEIKTSKITPNSDKSNDSGVPQVDLSHLTKEKQELVRNMIMEEKEVFS